MAYLTAIPANNSVDVVVSALALSSATGTPIVDAAMTFTVKDGSGNTVLGPTAMPYNSEANEYRGSFNSSALAVYSQYTVLVSASNYTFTRQHTYTVALPDFSMQ